MAHRRLPKTCYRSPKGRAENGAPLPLNKLLLGAKHRLPMERNALWHTTLRVLSVDTVRAVNEKGYDAVFAEQWKTELSECDIDPEAVSVDSEAHDMENGRDGLDGNAPEKDAPEKDNRDAQPPVDTDNR